MKWIQYFDVTNLAVVELDDWINSLPPRERDIQLGQLDDLFEAAALGQLWDAGDETTKIKPIRKDPEIFELRRTALSKRLRFYHGEPSSHPDVLVALHKHIKQGAAHQQEQIELASRRYRASTGWATFITSAGNNL